MIKLIIGARQTEILVKSLISTATNGYLESTDRKVANNLLKKIELLKGEPHA